MYTFLIFVHIAAAAVWIGAAIRQLAEEPVFGSGEPVARALWHRSQAVMGLKLFTPAAVVVLASGIWMVLISDTIGFGTTFVSVGFMAVIIGAVLGPMLGRRGEQAAARLDEGNTGAAADIARKTRSLELLDVAVLLVALASMVWKWGL